MLFGTTSADYRGGGWPPEDRNKCFAPEVSTIFFLIVMDSSPFNKPISIGDWSAIVFNQSYCLSAELITHPFLDCCTVILYSIATGALYKCIARACVCLLAICT